MSLPTYAIPGDPDLAPFVIEVGLTSAKAVLGKGLVRSGLLAHLPVELLPVLIALLSRLDPTGEARASTISVARILGIHPDDAEARLSRLAAFPSEEQSLAYLNAGAWGLSKQYIVPVQQSLSLVSPDEETYRPVAREQVIQQSRERYATPLKEAEALITEQLGIEPMPDGPEGEALQAMLNVGVPLDMGRELLATFPLSKIQVQLHWLPKRAARNPGRYLVSAIQGDFGPPGSPKLHADSLKAHADSPKGQEGEGHA